MSEVDAVAIDAVCDQLEKYIQEERRKGLLGPFSAVTGFKSPEHSPNEAALGAAKRLAAVFMFEHGSTDDFSAIRRVGTAAYMRVVSEQSGLTHAGMS